MAQSCQIFYYIGSLTKATLFHQNVLVFLSPLSIGQTWIWFLFKNMMTLYIEVMCAQHRLLSEDDPNKRENVVEIASHITYIYFSILHIFLHSKIIKAVWQFLLFCKHFQIMMTSLHVFFLGLAQKRTTMGGGLFEMMQYSWKVSNIEGVNQ